MAEEKFANEAEGQEPVAVPEETPEEVAPEPEEAAKAELQPEAEVEEQEAPAEAPEEEAAPEEAEEEAVPEEPAEPAASEESIEEEAKEEPAKKKKRRFRDRPHWKATVVVIVVVVVAAFSAFWVWHNTPEFCDAICHNPQDPYNPTYYATPGESATDKWGNEVEDASSMLSATHRAYGDLVCIDCHVPVLTEQVTEGFVWLTGNFYNPLSERSLENLTKYRKIPGEEFCLNENCHNMSKSDLTAATAVYDRNPHEWHHFEYTCSDCHKSHRASIMVCTECHEDAVTPDSWLTVEESRNLDTIYAAYDTESFGK